MRRNNSAEPTRALPEPKIDAEPSSNLEAQSEAEAARKLFRLNWLLITLALAAFDLLLLLTDFRIRPNGYLIALTAAAIYGVCGHLTRTRPRAGPGYSRC